MSGESKVLEDAICNRDFKSVVNAVKAGESLSEDEFGESPLMKAALSGSLEIVRYLCEETSGDVNHTGKTGANALVRAAISGNLAVIQYIVQKGADLNVIEEPYMACGTGFSVMTGWESHHGTAIMAAAAVGSLEIVRYLARAGADLALRDARGYDVFAQAVRYNQPAIIEYLLEKMGITDFEGMFIACRLNLNALKMFVEKMHTDVNAKDGEGNTPLLSAIRDGVYKYLESGPHPGYIAWKSLVTEYLLKKGADVNQRNAKGLTALMYAAAAHDSNCAAVLLKNGADPLAKDPEGRRASAYVVYPDEPPESHENSHDSWMWECDTLERFRDFLLEEEAKAEKRGVVK